LFFCPHSCTQGSNLVAIPVALAYNFFLDRFVQGLSLGAVKG
jgi:ABC-type glycerol-3-phosphate transport system permease component